MYYILIAAFWVSAFTIGTCHNYIKRERYFKNLYKSIKEEKGE